MATVLLLAALARRSGGGPAPWLLLAGAGLLLVLSLARPAWLTLPNRAWMKLGSLLQRLTQPVILSVGYFVVLTPIAALARRMGKDPLRLKLDRRAPTYWIARDRTELTADSLKNQY